MIMIHIRKYVNLIIFSLFLGLISPQSSRASVPVIESERYRTTAFLQRIIQESNDQTCKDIATHVLRNYRDQDINRNEMLGFWWHEKGLQVPIGPGCGTDIIYVHAHCNPIDHLSRGPWHTELHFGGAYRALNKSQIRREFEKVGFHCTQDDGWDIGEGRKALDFKLTH